MVKFYISFAKPDGYGYSIVDKKTSKMTSKDILELAENIKKWNNFPYDIVILSWQKLDKD